MFDRIRERRERGLNLANLVEVARGLKESGEIDKDTSPAEVAAAIAVKLQEKNADTAAADWESIISLIERLLPLILKLIDLFG